MKKLIIFDLDGTLLNTAPGIMYCYSKTGELLGLSPKSVENATCVIGGPLKDGFASLYDIKDEKELESAVSTYRELYKTEGVSRFDGYEGLEESLIRLRNAGLKLAVATLKLEAYAVSMLESAGFAKYFDCIGGWDGTDGCDKAFILNKAMEKLCVSAEDSVLIGDSVYDEKGAQKAGVDFVGVSYGFGIKPEDKSVLPYPVASTPKEFADFILDL